MHWEPSVADLLAQAKAKEIHRLNLKIRRLQRELRKAKERIATHDAIYHPKVQSTQPRD